MTVQLDLPSAVVARLTEDARHNGLSLDDYLLKIVLQSGAIVLGDEAQHQAREAAGRSIRELRKGNVHGSEVTIRDLVEEGRRF